MSGRCRRTTRIDAPRTCWLRLILGTSRAAYTSASIKTPSITSPRGLTKEQINKTRGRYILKVRKMDSIRKAWDWFARFIGALEYSLDDYIYDRIRGLEREVEQLKDEKSRTRS